MPRSELGLSSTLWGLLRSPVPPAFAVDLRLLLTLTFLLVVQVASGILLSFYYQATPVSVAESIQQIVRDVEWGWLVRGMHHWTGQAAILVAVLTLARSFLQRAYRGEGSTAWYAGVLVVAVLVVSSYTGELLAWDDQAFWRVSRSLTHVQSIPVAGASLARILRGGDDVSATTLGRLHSAHSLVLPWLVWLLLVLDGWMLARRLRAGHLRADPGGRP